MLFTFGTAVTMLVQVAASHYNQKWNRENTENLRQIQQEAKRASLNNSLRRDYESFLRSCQFQIEMENDSRKERLAGLNQEFLNSFKKMAHNVTLASHYPLRISPYIIQRSVVPSATERLEDTREDILCILTNSNEQAFNNEVLPYIDEMLCYNISKYWNKGSMHNVCYYQGIWDSKKNFYDEDIDNIKAVICSPTLTISPYFIKEILNIKINLWGMGYSDYAIIDTGINIKSLLSNEIDETVTMLKPTLLCAVGLMADVFYWITNYQVPLLPLLISNGTIQISSELKNEMIVSYDTLYRSLALGMVADEHTSVSADQRQALVNNSELNMFNFPCRDLGFLKSCIALMGASDKSNMLIEQTMLAIYKANAGEAHKSLQEINVRRLNYDIMANVTTLIKIANKSGNTETAKRLTTLISRKIKLHV